MGRIACLTMLAVLLLRVSCPAQAQEGQPVGTDTASPSRPAADAAASGRVATAPLPSDAARKKLDQALAAFGRGDDAAAVRTLVPLARAGDAAAQIGLAAAYRDGRGVSKDIRQAVTWWRLAARQGAAVAQTELGLAYRDGRGVARDDSEAARLLRQAADQGNALAQLCLGALYAEGRGVPKDPKAAIAWFRKAADQGGSGALETAGKDRGALSMPEDLPAAYMWMNVAAGALPDSDAGQAEQAQGQVAAMMTPQEVANAQRLSARVQPRAAPVAVAAANRQPSIFEQLDHPAAPVPSAEPAIGTTTSENGQPPPAATDCPAAGSSSAITGGC